MGQTTNLALPYPEQSDPADVPTDLRELAERVDTVLPPVGSPMPWLVSAIPAGYREFDGSAIVQATHPKLYALFGATMPDLRGRVLMGTDGTHAIGTAGGEAAHALTVPEMPSHTHDGYIYVNAQPTGIGGNTVAAFNTGTGALVALPAGGNGSHNNLQPYRTVRWITVAG